MESQKKPEDDLPNLAPAQFTAIRDLVLSAGGALQGFKPGALEKVAQVIERDLASVEALAKLSTVGKLRGERFAEALRAAETLRAAAQRLVFALDMADPAEATIIHTGSQR